MICSLWLGHCWAFACSNCSFRQPCGCTKQLQLQACHSQQHASIVLHRAAGQLPAKQMSYCEGFLADEQNLIAAEHVGPP